MAELPHLFERAHRRGVEQGCGFLSGGLDLQTMDFYILQNMGGKFTNKIDGHIHILKPTYLFCETSF